MIKKYMRTTHNVTMTVILLMLSGCVIPWLKVGWFGDAELEGEPMATASWSYPSWGVALIVTWLTLNFGDVKPALSSIVPEPGVDGEAEFDSTRNHVSAKKDV